MPGRDVEIKLRVRIPEGADASTVEKLILEAGREAMQEAVREAAEDSGPAEECPACGKKGQCGTDE